MRPQVIASIESTGGGPAAYASHGGNPEKAFPGGVGSGGCGDGQVCVGEMGVPGPVSSAH